MAGSLVSRGARQGDGGEGRGGDEGNNTRLDATSHTSPVSNNGHYGMSAVVIDICIITHRGGVTGRSTNTCIFHLAEVN